MSNTQQSPDPIVFVPTSISEKPPQSHRRYLLIGNVGGGHVMAFGAATDNGEWFFESGDDRKVRITDAFTHWLNPTPLSSLLKDKQKRIEELEAERDNFAISFAGWVISPEGQMYLATKMSASQLLKTYKDRPYININSSKQ